MHRRTTTELEPGFELGSNIAEAPGDEPGHRHFVIGNTPVTISIIIEIVARIQSQTMSPISRAAGAVALDMSASYVSPIAVIGYLD